MVISKLQYLFTYLFRRNFNITNGNGANIQENRIVGEESNESIKEEILEASIKDTNTKNDT